jgi:hypothetical protein
VAVIGAKSRRHMSKEGVMLEDVSSERALCCAVRTATATIISFHENGA